MATASTGASAGNTAVGSKPAHSPQDDEALKKAQDQAAQEAVDAAPVQFFSNMQPKTSKADPKWPKMVYGEGGQTRILADAKEEKALKGTWHDNPSDVKGAPKESAPAAEAGAVPVNVPRMGLENLPENHTYRDRVEAQARAYGVEVKEGETLEYLMWKINMQISS